MSCGGKTKGENLLCLLSVKFSKFTKVVPHLKLRIKSNPIVIKSGYQLLDHFILSEESWLSNYYSPLEKELATLKKDLSKDEETKEVVQSYKDEIELYKRFKDYFGYGFYVARKVN
ncbi:hypothetical protein OAT29_01975 [Flavobacteriaceae bacterium]|nr:hypothetical protein [Flavobacteriaceae bacterium]